MPDITIVCWRDIPAQVIVGGAGRGRGRGGARAALPERFEQAIDRAAMKVGARDSDAYLAEWRKVPAGSREGDSAAIAEEEARRIEVEYDAARLKALVDNEGRA